MNARFILIVCMLLLCVLQASCSESEKIQAAVVARVNGDVITEDLWNAAVEDLERSTGATLDAAGRRKVLESLVQSRLMAKAAETMLDEQRREELEAQIQLQRERLLVKEYLRRTAAPSPVTENEIRDYYAQHPDLFGGITRRYFELLTTENAPVADKRNAVLDVMNSIREQADWKTHAGIEGVRWVHRLENDANTALDSRILAVARSLKQGESSEPVFIGGRPYLLRVTRIEASPPKPLAEVRGDIQRRLQLQRLQQAVEEAGKALLGQAKVEYLVPGSE